MVAVIVPTVVASICPFVVTARVLVPWMSVVTSIVPVASCMAYPRIVVVMITEAIMNRISTRCGIGRTAGAGVVGILLHCLHVGRVLCGFD